MVFYHEHPVLVVEDDIVSGVMIQQQLKSMGLQVEWHDRGASAVEALEHREFCLVITDWFMPGMDGGAFLDLVRSRDKTLPVICVSANPDRLDLQAIRASGAMNFLSKPVDKRSLTNAVMGVLGHGG